MNLLLLLLWAYSCRALAFHTIVEPIYTLSIEFTANSFTNVSTRVERASWGQAVVDLFQPPNPKQALFELANEDGTLSPKRNANLKPGKALKLTALHRELNIVDFDFTQGTATAQIGASVASITCVRSGVNGTRVNQSGYIEAVAANTPRIDYSPSNVGACLGLWVEESRVQRLTHSNAFDAAWTKETGTTTTSGARTGPDGLQSMTLLAANSGFQAGINLATTVSSGQVHAFSAYLYPGAVPEVLLALQTTSASAIFNVLSGTLKSTGGSVTSAWIEPFRDGMYRAVVCSSLTNGSELPTIRANASSGDFYAAFAQLEPGDFPSSYIPSSGAASTRPVDNLLITDIGSFFSTTEGTMYSAWKLDRSNQSATVWEFSDNTANNLVRLRYATVNNQFATVNSGVTQANLTRATQQPIGNVYRSADHWKVNDFAKSADGDAVTTDVAGSMPVGINRLALGSIRGTSQHLNGHLMRLRYHPRAEANEILPMGATGNFSAPTNDVIGYRSLSTYPLFFGRITEVSLSPRVGARTTLLEAIDEWDRVNRITYTTSLYQNTPVQSIFCTLMSLSNVRSFSADSSIADRVGFTWYRDRSAPAALHELVKSGNYKLLVDGNGTFYLRDRYWYLFNSSVATYAVADEMRMSLTRESVINQMKMNSAPRRLSTDIATVGFIPQALTIPASSSIGFWLAYQDPREASADLPVASFTTPVASTDYFAAANSDGTGTDYTANLSLSFTGFAASAVCSIYNGGPEVWLTRFQVRGYPAVRLPPFGTQFDVVSSQNDFGVRNVTVENAIVQDRPFMDSLCRAITAERKDGKDQLALSLANEFPDILATNPGDIFSSVDNFGGYVGLWTVRSSEHEISLTQGLRHSASYTSEGYDLLPFLVLDSATQGALDNGRLLAI